VPEGHTLHRYAQEMAELVGCAVAATSPQQRFPAEAIDRVVVTSVEAYGKNLLVDSEAGTSVHVHLGMRGKWLRFSPVTGPGLPQVRLRLTTPDVAWDLIAPSRCTLLDRGQRQQLIDSLGPDPLRPEADPEEAYRRVAAFPGPIGAALLDQGRIAGVGNVFRAEALHALGIAPIRPAGEVSAAEFRGLWRTLQEMMRTAVIDGRIITVDPVQGADRLTVREEHSRRVYKQMVCYDCGTPIEQANVGQRTSYACPRCQPR
jgi:endonuclease VIII